MTDDTTILPFHQPGSIIDPLTEIAREGARRMLMAALKAEADSFVVRFGDELLPDGRQRIVRHGAGPERAIQTGIGPITVQRQKVRDRAAHVLPEAKIRFTSIILPKWARRSKSLDALLPIPHSASRGQRSCQKSKSRSWGWIGEGHFFREDQNTHNVGSLLGARITNGATTSSFPRPCFSRQPVRRRPVSAD